MVEKIAIAIRLALQNDHIVRLNKNTYDFKSYSD